VKCVYVCALRTWSTMPSCVYIREWMNVCTRKKNTNHRVSLPWTVNIYVCDNISFFTHLYTSHKLHTPSCASYTLLCCKQRHYILMHFCIPPHVCSLFASTAPPRFVYLLTAFQWYRQLHPQKKEGITITDEEESMLMCLVVRNIARLRMNTCVTSACDVFYF
jgi:hypothetical protein